MLSPVFSQNIYQGLLTGLAPENVSPEISLFTIDADKFPLLKEAESYI